MVQRMSYTSLVVSVVLGSAGLALSRQEFDRPRAANQIQTPPFTACIDDSDCTGIGNKYACFQYICYPYEDDSSIAPHHKKKYCNRKDECDHGEACYRHYDRRHVHTGLCMGETRDCSENGDNDCSERCCNRQFCCEEEYYLQLQSLPCHSNHDTCRDLGYGEWCCPAKTNTTSDYCCNTNPNPPPPTKRPQASRDTSAASYLQPLVSLFLIIKALALLI